MSSSARAWCGARVWAAALPVLLTACTVVGPNYVGPPEVAKAAIDGPAFHRAALAPVTPAPPPARWWDAVGDPVLTQLVAEACAASPTLEAALARVRSARAQQALNRAGLGPTGGVSGRYVRSRIPTGSLNLAPSGGSGSGSAASTIPNPIDLELYSTSVDASWEIDLFGGKRRGIEAANASAEAQQAAYEDVQVRLASDVGQAYAQLRGAQNQLALAERSIALGEQSLALTRQRRERGTVAQGDLAQAETSLAQARAELPGMQTQIEQQLDQLATLAGREPGAYDALLAVPETQPVAQPAPPDTVPVGQPADWLRRRPDIRQAERTLAARNAAIGQNMAQLFPSVTLLGFAASSGAHLGDLFKGPPLWLLTPALTWNFFAIPSTQARVVGAEAERDASLADYRRAVLSALQDANGALSRFGRQQKTVVQRDAASVAAARAAQLARERYEHGSISLINALDAERQRLQADGQRAQAGADLMVAYVALQKSLGLGWSPAPPAEPAAAGERAALAPLSPTP